MNVGILGGGQLGQMLALAGRPLGLEFRVLDPNPEAPAGRVATHLVKPFDDVVALDEMSDGVDVVTYEFENVSVELARHLAERGALHPAPQALELAQDRMVEKDGFRSIGIPTAPYRAVSSLEDLRAAVEAISLPAVLKTRRFGYDGKGQSVIRDASEVEAAWEAVGPDPLILEGFVDFDRELSLVAVRGADGTVVDYPLVENVHVGGILRQTTAPAPDVSPALQDKAERYVGKLLDVLDYVGVIAVELFQCGDELLANEMAPRVHNSGHWTQDGTAHSQFENHVRAVCGLPLAPVEPIQPTVMVNLIGEVPDVAEMLALPGVHLHLYGKEPREGRKLGHVNVVGDHPGTVARLREMTGLT